MKQGKYRIYAPTRLAGTKALCERLGICRSYLYMITRGKCKPSPRLAARIRRMGLLPEAAKALKEGGAE